jgi:hypothetical protein
MKKIILIVLSIILITIPAWGNAAAPSQDPETNMLFFSDDTGISLVEEWITFTVDEEWDQRAQVEVKYILKNIDNEEENIKLMFLGPGMASDEAKIKADGKVIGDIRLVESSGIPENWESVEDLNIYEPVSGKLLERGFSGYGRGTFEDKGYEFSIDIPLDETVELEIQYESWGGYYSYNEVVNDVNTQIYYLTPARFWEGNAKVNIAVVFPNDNYEIHSNIDLEKTNQNTYSIVLDEIPEEEWYFHYVSREGLTFGTNYIKTNNTIAGAIVVMTLALGFYFMKKKKKAVSIIIFLLTIPEFFLFRFSGYGGLFLLFIGIPIVLISAVVVGLVKLYMSKRDKNRL